MCEPKTRLHRASAGSGLSFRFFLSQEKDFRLGRSREAHAESEMRQSVGWRASTPTELSNAKRKNQNEGSRAAGSHAAYSLSLGDRAPDKAALPGLHAIARGRQSAEESP